MTSASPTTTDEIPLPRVFTRRISRPGLITGVLFFVVSLLPSMLPRSSITQGVVCGIAFMIGYALGAAWQWAPDLRGRMADGDPGHDRSRRADPHRGPLPAEVVPPHYPMAGTASSAAAGPASRRGRLGAAPVGSVEWNSGEWILRRRQPDLRSPGYGHRPGSNPNRSRRTGPAARSQLFPGRAWVGKVAPSSPPGPPSGSSTPTTAGTLLSRSGCTPG
jgi:Alpha/beta-hydrolase family N-terminus